VISHYLEISSFSFRHEGSVIIVAIVDSRSIIILRVVIYY